MTKEEALKRVKGYLTDYLPADCNGEVEEIMEALEQEPILDKIRAEIDGAKMPKNRMSFFRDGINYALEIIDKYKAESEDKE